MGYVHNLSPLKTSKDKNTYFDVTLQTNRTTCRTVCFAPEKQETLQTRHELTSPIKVKNYQKRQNRFSRERKIIASKRTKLEELNDSKLNFNYNDSFNKATPATKAPRILFSNVKVLLLPSSPVSITGKVTLQGDIQDHTYQGRTLQMQKAVITDEAGSMQVVCRSLTSTRSPQAACTT